MQPTALAEGDELLDDRPQVLRLRQGRDDLLVLDQRRRHVGEHGAAMLGGAVELAVGIPVAHRTLQTNDSNDENGGAAEQSSVVLCLISNDPRNAWPAHRCCRAASPALPCRGGAPSAPALP